MRPFTLMMAVMGALPCMISAQRTENFWLKQAASAGAMITAGWMHGEAEVLLHDYRRFAAKRPSVSEQWANPRHSFKNKYRDWPTDTRAAFPGSKTILVFTTDKYHLNYGIKNFLLAGNVGISMTLYEKPKLKHLALQAVTSFFFYSLGTGMAHAYYGYVDR